MNVIHHQIERRAHERMKRCKIWTVIALCVAVAAFLIILAASQIPADFQSRHFGQSDSTDETKGGSGSKQPVRKVPSGEGLPINLLPVFRNFSSLIGTTKKDANGLSYRINDFFLRDVQLYTFDQQSGPLFPQRHAV